MSQFWAPDDASKERSEESQRHRRPGTFSGVDTIRGTVQAYTGVVQSIEDHGIGAPQGRRWRITILPE
jgi:hypothetical protein